MVNIPGYRIADKIYAGARTTVYRAIRERDQKSVIIKLMGQEYPSFNEIVQFRNQYAIAKNLNLPGVVKPYSLETYNNGYALVMEDFGGVSLKQWENNSYSLNDFFGIAIQVATTLDQLHRDRVIHKDIKPANIVINPQTQQVKLIDFSIASFKGKRFRKSLPSITVCDSKKG